METAPAWVAGEAGEKPMTPMIPLVQMRQQATISVSEEDWLGITDPAERRKRQNRINQRLYRRRHQSTSQRDKTTKSKARSIENQIPKSEQEDEDNLEADSEGTNSVTNLSLSPAESTVQVIQYDPPDFQSEGIAPCDFTSSDAQNLIRRFEAWAAHIRRAAHPSPSHLPMLIKFNVWRAFVSNTVTLGLSIEQQSDDNALSPFTANSPPIPHLLPAALVPTALQRRIPHHPWVDILPFPRMRDNLIRAGDEWDDELCADMIGFFHAPSRREGVIVWGEPWDPRGWEATEDFVRYWGWAIEGCCEIVESTNYWRARRGERPLWVAGCESKRSK